MNQDQILLGHGSGGKLSHELIKNLFFKYFPNPFENKDTDSASLSFKKGEIGFTTDSFVVDPLEFPGGNIGHLAVSGTVNDLAVSGYIPKYLSAGFIIEEGLPFSILERVVKSMAEEAKKAGVYIVTGDTKVVNKGKCDKLFINTSGIGELHPNSSCLKNKIEPGDKIAINGFIAEHGIAVMTAREGMAVTNIESDVAPLNGLIKDILDNKLNIKFMRDATRGGVATILSELVDNKTFGVTVDEEEIPVQENVKGVCEILGFDPLYVANEGKVVIVVSDEDADKLFNILKNHPLGNQSKIFGEITDTNKGFALMQTTIGGKRIIDMLAGEQLPRIC
jgi:hydrogenase expression/formation protein HypE